MRILLLHEYYLRPDDAGGSRFNEMCRYWAQEGAEVTVIAGQVHYSSGKKALDYSGRTIVEEWDGPTRVIRTWAYEHQRRTTYERMFSMAAWSVTATLAAVEEAGRYDIVIASSPSLLVLLTGMGAQFAARVPLIVEVRDLWPESAITTGIIEADSFPARALYELESLGYTAANKIVALTPGIKNDIVRRELKSADDVVVIPNGVDISALPTDFDTAAIREKYGWGDRFVVIYAGAHGVANKLDQLVEVAQRLREREDILFVAIGDGGLRERLIADSNQRHLPNLQWLEAVPKAEMYAHIAAADAGAAILQRNPTFRTVYPNKIFDYMALGKPVLCGVDGDARSLIEGAGAGLFVVPENPQSFVDAVVQLADHPEDGAAMGAAGRRLVENEFDRRELARQYLELLVHI